MVCKLGSWSLNSSLKERSSDTMSMSSDMWIIACEVAVRQVESGEPPGLFTGDTLPVAVAVFVSLS
jgi:hypothetical protein